MSKSKSIKTYLKELRSDIRTYFLYKKSRTLVQQLQDIFAELSDSIPVLVISYNNGVYVENTCRQLKKFGIKPVIIDNNSTCKKTLQILDNLEKNGDAFIARSKHNFGHEVGFIQPVYDTLPDVFAYTDPDLQYNENLPENFLDILSQLTVDYSVFKAGFALDLEPEDKLKDTTFYSYHNKPIHYKRTHTIKEFESKHWDFRLQHSDLEIYASRIDTTFAVYRKQNYIGDFHRAVRVAGDFSALHLPWFTGLDLMNDTDRETYNKKNRSSNWTT